MERSAICPVRQFRIRPIRFAKSAACALLERVGATVVGCAFLLGLAALGGEAKLAGREVRILLNF